MCPGLIHVMRLKILSIGILFIIAGKNGTMPSSGNTWMIMFRIVVPMLKFTPLEGRLWGESYSRQRCLEDMQLRQCDIAKQEYTGISTINKG
eukprot:7481310-Ditylum_brightwellii.AAC.1